MLTVDSSSGPTLKELEKDVAKMSTFKKLYNFYKKLYNFL